MSVALDGQRLFDENELKIETGGVSREYLERTAAGLDGVISIDLGRRSRVIKQTGTLRSPSQTGMNERVSAITEYLDGKTHTLRTGDGQELENVRMDTFRIKNERTGGGGVCADYEIIYTQLLS